MACTGIDERYDADLKALENMKLHPEYLPYIGADYEKGRLLMVGESHYVDSTKFPQLEQFFCPAKWYKTSTDALFQGLDADSQKDWFCTRTVLYNFLSGRSGRAHSMFWNPVRVMDEVLNPNSNGEAFRSSWRYAAFLNYYQRPSCDGKTLSCSDEDSHVAFETLCAVAGIIRPQMILFLSRKAYKDFCSEKGKKACDSPALPPAFDLVHPTCAWWSRDEGIYGKEKLRGILDGYEPFQQLHA